MTDPADRPSGDDLSLRREGHIAVLEIHRPPANYFDEGLIHTLARTAAALDDDPTCRAVVLCAEGKHFCAGADFGDRGGFDEDRAAASERLYRQAVRLFRAATPIVAAVQGSAVGGGLGLACAADFRVAEPGSRFVANFARLGFHQGFGLSVTLPRIIGHQAAADMLFTGRRVTGEEARAIGLADRIAAPGGARGEAIAWAHEIAASAPLAVASIRATLRAGLADEVERVLDRELAEQTRLWATQDSAEGIAASLERRTPAFRGS
ncbi:enoyl-CoA hydratase [Streptomyces sp. CBMA29]|nr:enoyl-CoA hydratase [Streptomyces sp. CBMA29]